MFAGGGPQSGVGVDGHTRPDGAEHRDVVDAVAVGGAPRQVQALQLGKGLHGFRLGRAVQGLTDEPTRVVPVDHLRDRAERARQPEPLGDDARELDRRSGDQEDPLSGVEVGLRHGPGAGPDAGGHELVVDLLAVRHNVGNGLAGHQRQGLLPGLGNGLEVLLAADPEPQLLPTEPQQVAPRHDAAPGHPLAEEVDRCATNHRVVDVEEGGAGRVRDHAQRRLHLRGGSGGGSGQHRADPVVRSRSTDPQRPDHETPPTERDEHPTLAAADVPARAPEGGATTTPAGQAALAHRRAGVRRAG